jgi:hypothetical protein
MSPEASLKFDELFLCWYDYFYPIYNIPPRWNDIISKHGVFEMYFIVIKQTAPYMTTLIVSV